MNTLNNLILNKSLMTGTDYSFLSFDVFLFKCTIPSAPALNTEVPTLAVEERAHFNPPKP